MARSSIAASAGLALLLLAAHAAQPASAAAAVSFVEPPAGSMIFGAWLNTGEYPTDVDSPAAWNTRIGRRTAAFQLRRSIPPAATDPTVLPVELWDDNSTAAVFYTV
ncbi:hypothetical protein HK405_008913, partial [Cladochytrium tenue]